MRNAVEQATGDLRLPGPRGRAHPDGTELQLALDADPAARAYQQAMFQRNQPAAVFFTDDLQAEYERIKARGAEFTLAPTDVTASRIAILDDTCGNRIQLTQLMRG